MALGGYTTGTISIAANATSVVGLSTLWNNTNARPGDTLIVAGHQVVIQDVTDITHLVIDAWPYSAVTNSLYRLAYTSPLRYGANAQLAKDVSAVLAVLNATGFYVFVGVDETVPDPSLGDEGQFALQPSTGKRWHKEGGVWVFDGLFSGFGVPAPYDNAHTYKLMDVATSGGSSYVYINATPSAGHAPPNATYWAVLASIGATGPTGPVPFLPVVAWATATNYVVGPPASLVQQNGSAYTCLVAHTSGTFATDLAAGKWGLIASKGAGDLLSTNNLSDVQSKIAAHDNLIGRATNITGAATLDLDSVDGEFVVVTGSTNITAITLSTGRKRWVFFSNALTITAGATIQLPYGLASLAVASGDMIEFFSTAGLARAISYQPATRSQHRVAVGIPNYYHAFGFFPTGTGASSQVAMGLGSSLQVAPAITGRFRVTFIGQITAGSIMNGTLRIYFGTGTPPANNVAPTGTAIGPVITGTVAGASYNVPFCVEGIATGLALGTTYWFDITLSTGSGSTVTLQNVGAIIQEF